MHCFQSLIVHQCTLLAIYIASRGLSCSSNKQSILRPVANYMAARMSRLDSGMFRNQPVRRCDKGLPFCFCDGGCHWGDEGVCATVRMNKATGRRSPSRLRPDTAILTPFPSSSLLVREHEGQGKFRAGMHASTTWDKGGGTQRGVAEAHDQEFGIRRHVVRCLARAPGAVGLCAELKSLCLIASSTGPDDQFMIHEGISLRDKS